MATLHTFTLQFSFGQTSFHDNYEQTSGSQGLRKIR